MSEASEKQTAILLKNGFSQEDIDRMNKKTISDEIGKILGGSQKKPSQGGYNGKIGASEGLSDVKHYFQNSYEFGKAGNRHILRYWVIDELKEQLKVLEAAGLLDEAPEVQKI